MNHGKQPYPLDTFSLPFLVDLVERRAREADDSALQPIPADANPAAFVLGLRLGGRGRLKNAPVRLPTAKANAQSAPLRRIPEDDGPFVLESFPYPRLK